MNCKIAGYLMIYDHSDTRHKCHFWVSRCAVVWGMQHEDVHTESVEVTDTCHGYLTFAHRRKDVSKTSSRSAVQSAMLEET